MGLRPGRYFLRVTPSTATAGRDPVGRVVTGLVPRLGVPVYYPGVRTPDVRSLIDVRGVLSVQNIGVVIEERERTTVEGTVLASPAAPAGSNVFLNLSIPGLLSVSTAAKAGEPFRLGPVPAGFYILDAQSQGPQRSRVVQDLAVAGSKVSGVFISIPPPTELTGRVEIDDPSVRLTATVNLHSEKVPGSIGSSANAASGDFRIQGVISGEPYTMSVSRIPPVAYIAAVVQGTQEITHAPYSIYGGSDPIRILLKTDGGTIQGVARQNAQGVGRAFIVLAPKDRRMEQRFRTVFTAEDGTFRIAGIAPGEYDLLALDRNEDDDYLDETFLQTVVDRALKIAVEPRATQTVEIPLQYIPRR